MLVTKNILDIDGLEFSIKVRMRKADDTATWYAFPFQVKMKCFARKSNIYHYGVKVDDDSPGGQTPIFWKNSTDTLFFNIWYNGSELALLFETTDHLKEAYDDWSLDAQISTLVLNSSLKNKLVSYFQETIGVTYTMPIDFTAEMLNTAPGNVLERVPLPDSLDDDDELLRTIESRRGYADTEDSDSVEDVEESPIPFYTDVIFEEILPEECLPNEVTNLNDPDGLPSPFLGLNKEVCQSILPFDEDDLLLVDGMYLRVCPTCTPDLSITPPTIKDKILEMNLNNTSYTVWLDEATCEYKCLMKESISFDFIKETYDDPTDTGLGTLLGNGKLRGIKNILTANNKAVSDQVVCTNLSAVVPGECITVPIDVTHNPETITFTTSLANGINIVKQNVESGQGDGTFITIYGITSIPEYEQYISNPKALEIYSNITVYPLMDGEKIFTNYESSFWLVSTPANLVNLAEEDYVSTIKEETEEQLSSSSSNSVEGISETTINGDEVRQILKVDLPNLFRTFGEYQANYLYFQGGKLRINNINTDGTVDDTTSRPFYIYKYEKKFRAFYADLKKLLKRNRFFLYNEMGNNYRQAEKIKIKVNESYEITNVFANYPNCPVKSCRRGFREFADKYKKEKTLVSYVIRNQKMLGEIGNQLPPWLDFMIDYTWPSLVVSQGNSSQSVNYESCLDNPNNQDESVENLLDEFLLASVGSFSLSLEYTLNTLNCRKIAEYNLSSYKDLFEPFSRSENPQLDNALARYEKFGETVSDQISESLPGSLYAKTKRTYRKLLNDRALKYPRTSNLFEQLMGKPIEEFVEEINSDDEELLGELLAKINPCNWQKIILDILRCMMKGLNANTALKKIAKSLMGNLDPASFARIFVGLPQEVQDEVQDEIKSVIEELSWFQNYQAFNIDDYVALANKKEEKNPNTYQDERKDPQNPSPPPSADPSDISGADAAQDAYKTAEDALEDKVEEYNNQLKTEQEYQEALSRVASLKVVYDRLEQEKEIAEINHNNAIDASANEQSTDDPSLLSQDDTAATAAILESATNEYNLILEQYVAEINIKDELAVEVFDETGELKSVIMAAEIVDLKGQKNSAAIDILQELANSYSPNEYEKATRKIIEILGKVYIDLIIEKLSIDELKDLVDSLPGTDVFIAVINAALCPHKDLLDVWTKATWASLDINPCKSSSWKFPPIPEIPELNLLKIFEIVLQEFIKLLVKKIVAALVAFLMKTLRAILNNLCNLLQGLGSYLFNSDEPDGSGTLFDAVAASYCNNLFNNNQGENLTNGVNSSGLATVSDAMKKSTGITVPEDVIINWGTKISDSVPVNSWKELFVSGGTTQNNQLINQIWEITQTFPEISETAITSKEDLEAFFNLLVQHLDPVLALDIQNAINSLEGIWVNGGTDTCEIFCGDLDYGVQSYEDPGFTVNPNDFSKSFGDILNDYYTSPDDVLQDIFKDLSSNPFGTDPYCEDLRSGKDEPIDNLSGRQPLIPNQPSALTELKEQIAESVVGELEISYYNDLITKQHSFFNNLLADREHKKLTKSNLFDPSHEFREKTRYLFPNASNHQREHKNKWRRAGNFLKLLMRFDSVGSEDIRGVDTTDELDTVEVGEDDGFFDKIKTGIRNAFNAIIKGPVKKFLRIFRLKYPTPRNLFPNTVGLQYKESFTDQKIIFVNKTNTIKSSTSPIINIPELGLVSPEGIDTSIFDNPDSNADSSLIIKWQTNKKDYTIETGFNTHLYSENTNPSNGPHDYFVHTRQILKGVEDPDILKGYIENVDGGEDIEEQIDNLNSEIVATSFEIKSNLSQIRVKPSVSKFQDLYDTFTYNYANDKIRENGYGGSSNQLSECFESYCLRNYITSLIPENTIKYLTLSNGSINSTVTHYISQSGKKFDSTYNSLYFYDRVSQDMIGKLIKNLMNSQTGESNIFNFGYSVLSKIKFADITNVNPNADKNNPETWVYTKDEADKILGKPATENPRVVFLNPDIHGGSYKNPKIYIKPYNFKGMLGIMNYYVPEIDACEPKNEIKLFTKSVMKEITEMERTLTPDKRMSYDPDCVIEPPFDLIADSASHAYLHGNVKLTIRTYIVQFLLRSLPINQNIKFNADNFDLSLSGLIYELMKEGTNDTPRLFAFRKYSRQDYWTLLKEQMVQNVEREILNGNINKDEKLDSLFSKIQQARSNYYQPDKQDMQILKRIKKIKVIEKTDVNGEREDYENLVFHRYTSNGIKYFDIDIEWKTDIDFSNNTTYLNRIKKIVSASIFAALGKDGFRQLSMLGKAIKWKGAYTMNLKNTIMACKMYEIRLYENVVKEIAYYAIDLELKKYFKDLEQDQDSRDFASQPDIFNLSKFVLNPKSGLSLGPEIKIGTKFGEYRANNIEDYGDVNDYFMNTENQIGSLDESSIALIENIKNEKEHSFFLVEKYIKIGKVKNQEDEDNRKLKTIFKPFENKKVSIKKFKDLMKEVRGGDTSGQVGLAFSETSSISDYFGDATLTEDEQTYSGSIGIKFGVMLSYVRNDLPIKILNEFNINKTEWKKIKVTYDTLSSDAGIEIEFRRIPLLSYEQDINDFNMQDFVYSRCLQLNIQEEVKCYLDRMCELPEFSFLMEYCFPVKKASTLMLINSYYSYIHSIGKHETERDEWATKENPPDEEWKLRIMQETKDKLRKMFSRYYKSRDIDKTRGDRRNFAAEWLKFNLPDINTNLDRFSIKWWQLFRIVDRPFNKFDEDCMDGALGALNQKVPTVPTTNTDDIVSRSSVMPYNPTGLVTYEPEDCEDLYFDDGLEKANDAIEEAGAAAGVLNSNIRNR